MMSQDGAQMSAGITKPFNVVVGGAGIGLLLAAAGFAFLKSRRPSAGDIAGRALSRAPKPSISMGLKGKWALNGAIKMIEHDASRKVLLTVLKAMAKRAR